MELERRFKVEAELIGKDSNGEDWLALPWVGVNIKTKNGLFDLEYTENDIREMTVKVDEYPGPENCLIVLEFQSDETTVKFYISLDAARKLIEALKEVEVLDPVS